MLRKKKLFALLLAALMLLGLAATASADNSIDTGFIGEEEVVDPYDYATTPDGLYTFVYDGTEPLLSMDVDVSECIEGRLYVYDDSTEGLIEITDQTVTVYTATKDALYYVTEEQAIYKTDYTGRSDELLYQCPDGEIKTLASYLDLLYMIVDGNKVVLLDSTNGSAATVLVQENLDWVLIMSDTELMYVTIEEEYFVLNFSTKEITTVGSDLIATNMINQAVLEAAGIDEPDASVLATFSSSSVTQENNISFPLEEYDATIYPSTQHQNFNHPTPLSWFHDNGGEGCSSTNCSEYAGTHECEGFARYAHDAYLHIVDDTIGYSTWLSSKHPGSKTTFDGTSSDVKEFFSNMKTGAYIRYGKTSDTTPSNGVHSVVFVSADTSGIWVYECNQAYVDSDPDDYYGCGVHFQYYTYVKLAAQYQYVLHYVNHSFSKDAAYYNTTYHKVTCADCSGYVLQKHTDTALTYTRTSAKHTPVYDCCGAGTAVAHVYVNNRCKTCNFLKITSVSPAGSQEILAVAAA